MQKCLFIIPGSCATDTNWQALIDHYEEQNDIVEYFDYEADKHETMAACAQQLYAKIQSKIEILETQHQELEIKFMAHSMGGMLVIKIFEMMDSLKDLDTQAWDKFMQQEFMLIQTPLNANPSLQKVLGVVKYPVMFIMFFHSWFYAVLRLLLRLSWTLIVKPLINVPILGPLIYLHWLAASMHNGFWGSKPRVLNNLISYFNEWSELKPGDIEQALCALKGLYPTKICLTSGNLDFYCDQEATKSLCSSLDLERKEINYAFHNPHHLPWTMRHFL